MSSSTSSSSQEVPSSQESDIDTHAHAPCATDAGHSKLSIQNRLDQLNEFYCPLCDLKDKYVDRALQKHFTNHENGRECQYCRKKTVFDYTVLEKGCPTKESIYHRCTTDREGDNNDMNMNKT